MSSYINIIHGNLRPQSPNVSQPKVNEANDGKVMDLEFVKSKAAVMDHHYADIRDITLFQQCMEHGDSTQSGFNIGWVETNKANKCRKSETKRKTPGVDLGLTRPTQEEDAQPKGTWTRVSRPVMGKEERPKWPISMFF